MENTIYLLTGAAGFLGSHICKELIERGDRVRALALPGDASVQYLPEETEIATGDLCDPASLERFFTVPDGTDTVMIHCASMVTLKPEFSQKLMDINVGGTKNVIDACLHHPECKKMVYISSTGAIPELPKGQKIKEVSHFDPDLVVGCYSQSKAIATQAVLDAANTRHLNACVVHPSGIIGPGDYAREEVTRTLIKVLNGELSAGMAGSFNLCDVRDLAHGCVMAADRGRRGECYILANQEVTLREMCEILEADAHCRGPKFYLPLGIASWAARRMEHRAEKTGKAPILSSFAVYNLARNNSFDSSKAAAELDYHTRPYRETLHDLALWLQEEHMLRAA